MGFTRKKPTPFIAGFTMVLVLGLSVGRLYGHVLPTEPKATPLKGAIRPAVIDRIVDDCFAVFHVDPGEETWIVPLDRLFQGYASSSDRATGSPMQEGDWGGLVFDEFHGFRWVFSSERTSETYERIAWKMDRLRAR